MRNHKLPPHKDQHFYPRIKNLTNIRFDKEETQMLNYGLNYCIERPVTAYFTNLLAETERAIKLLDGKMQNTYRLLATNKLKQIINSTNQQNATLKRQLHIMKKLKQKLATENAIITQADKGKTVVIINSDEYSRKIHSFLTTNNFSTITRDPTDRYQKHILKTIQECSLIIDKRQIKYLTQKKPAPPVLKAQLKLHKTDIPIRPVINNRSAPSYKLAKHLTKILNRYITLNNHYNVTNSTNLAHDLIKLKIHENHKMITYDIKYLYVNVPMQETLNILNIKLLENTNTQMTHHILSLMDTPLSQNYFTYQNKI
jgi:hypothetical protein